MGCANARLICVVGANPVNSKLTPEIAEALAEAAGAGLPIGDCAAIVGISRRTLTRWLELGDADLEKEIDTNYASFVLQFRAKRAELRRQMLQLVREAAVVPQNWAAAMTFLERSDPANWGKRDTTVIEGGATPLIEINIGDPVVRAAVGQALQAIAGSGPAELER